MPDTYVVVWGKTGVTQKLIPVDEKFYTESIEAAKEAAKELLVPMNKTLLVPVEVLKISEEKFQAMLTGTTPLLTFNMDSEYETEMLELAP